MTDTIYISITFSKKNYVNHNERAVYEY